MKTQIPKSNLGYSIFLSIDSGKSNGSGFRMKFEDKNYIVSAKHVFFKEDGCLWGDNLLVTCQSVDNSLTEPIIFEVNLKEAKIYPSKSSDIVVILIGSNVKLYDDETPLKNLNGDSLRPTTLYGEQYVTPLSGGKGKAVSVDPEATRNIDEIGIANDVYLIGYPISLGMQKNEYFDYSKPLLRKGIIAGINKQTFIIDCPSYQGNSGGPIIEHCEDDLFRVIGVVSRYIPFETKWFSNRERITNMEITNSGYTVCVSIDEVLSVLKTIK